MSLTSLVDAEYTAIVTRFQAAAPVATALQDYSQLGFKTFNRPPIPNVTALADSVRSSKLASVVWVSLMIAGSAGSSRPQGISPTSQGHREGLVIQSVHFPVGPWGLDWLLPIVDDCREVFHRQTLTLSGGWVHFRDSDPPVRADRPEDRSSGWGFFNVVTPYWVREAN